VLLYMFLSKIQYSKYIYIYIYIYNCIICLCMRGLYYYTTKLVRIVVIQYVKVLPPWGNSISLAINSYFFQTPILDVYIYIYIYIVPFILLLNNVVGLGGIQMFGYCIRKIVRQKKKSYHTRVHFYTEPKATDYNVNSQSLERIKNLNRLNIQLWISSKIISLTIVIIIFI
jgi:hypothetical protein